MYADVSVGPQAMIFLLAHIKCLTAVYGVLGAISHDSYYKLQSLSSVETWVYKKQFGAQSIFSEWSYNYHEYWDCSEQLHFWWYLCLKHGTHGPGGWAEHPGSRYGWQGY